MIRIYQYLSPIILTPLSFYLWSNVYSGNVFLILNAWLVPILWAYIVPGIGTNICKVWEFDVKFKLGKFRPHHGFVFGSATSMFGWLVHMNIAKTYSEIFIFGIICCSVIGFWNLFYEIKALKCGVLKVYNQPWADGKSNEEIALDYSPWFFGGFGFIYGCSISFAEILTLNSKIEESGFLCGIYILLSLVLSIFIPLLGFIRKSIKIHGHSGTKPIIAKKYSN